MARKCGSEELAVWGAQDKACLPSLPHQSPQKRTGLSSLPPSVHRLLPQSWGPLNPSSSLRIPSVLIPSLQGTERLWVDERKGVTLSMFQRMGGSTPLLPGRNVAVVHVSRDDNSYPASVSLKEPPNTKAFISKASPAAPELI